MRLAQGSLRADMLVAGVGPLEVIELYPEDKYLPSYLLRGEIEGRVFLPKLLQIVKEETCEL